MSQNSPEKNLQYIVYILFFMLLLLPGSVVAQDSIDIKVGAMHSFPWNATALKPGSSGTASIDIFNNGTLEGSLFIWVTNISQTDAFGNGAALGKYMYFGIANPVLVSSIPLPSRIDAFPTSPISGPYLVISPVRPAETITLNWTWEFVDTGQLQNDAQGDTLRFDINYMLVNGPPPTPTLKPTIPPGGGGGASYHTFTGSGRVQTLPTMNLTPAETITPQPVPLAKSTVPPSAETGKRVPFGMDYWFIFIIAVFILLGLLILVRRRKQKQEVP